MAADHFIVSKKESGVAIFSLAGKKIFDFVKCHFIAYDKTTQTVVITQKSEKNLK